MSEYLEGIGIHYEGTLLKTKKSSNYLQPIYEALTNSIEAIKLLKVKNNTNENGSIKINIFFKEDLISDQTDKVEFDKIQIIDTGIGFDPEGFDRFSRLNDTSKGYLNKGSGRVQFLHAFERTEYLSIYENSESPTGYSQRSLTISKSPLFLNHNAIIRLEKDDQKGIAAEYTSTTVTFNDPVSKKDKALFSGLTLNSLRQEIIHHYLAYFCENRDTLPEIKIQKFINDACVDELVISGNEIPQPDHEKEITVYYSNLNGSKIDNTSENEEFSLKAFKIHKNELNSNALKLISKGEVAQRISLNSLSDKDDIDGYRYLFLLSGDYINNKDSDTRGYIELSNRSAFKKKYKDDLYCQEEILIEDIEKKANSVIINLYDEIKQKNEEKDQNIEKLRKMFLLDNKTLKDLAEKININDSDDVILRKVYEYEAKKIAKGDAEIKRKIKEIDGKLEEIDTSSDEFETELNYQVDEFLKIVPEQNRTALTHYVARRKLVLDLFDKIIHKELVRQNIGDKSIDEKLLHNLIFQQSSGDSGSSDLWLINEDFIYFKGTSEDQLSKVLFDGHPIIKAELTEEEEAYRLKQQGDAAKKRPDVLLFPSEGKCIIIEFKSLDTNISDHLNQINRYASLINNLAKDQFNFNTYYGYLIGENIDIDDIEDNDADFKSAHSLNYIFRPHKRISGKFGKSDGSLYTEIIKYSTLLERAKQRNKIFIDKLIGS